MNNKNLYNSGKRYSRFIQSIRCLIFFIILFPFGLHLYYKFIKDSFIINTLPSSDKKEICFDLQSEIKDLIGNDIENWSISAINNVGIRFVDINGSKVRIPASNQKLITTAYALDKLGPFHKFKTSIYKSSPGTYIITGEGDPDIGYKDINTMVSVIRKDSKKKRDDINITLIENPKNFWWPNSWTFADTYQAYGAPITQLSINSNSKDEVSFDDPVLEWKNYLYEKLNKYGYTLRIEISNRKKHIDQLSHSRRLKVINSAPLYALINLANAESHNFTSEILLRNTAQTWNPLLASKSMEDWFDELNLTTSSFNFVDGSGLSRKNGITTNQITKLLYFMSSHPHSEFYNSSMAILGLRGTLRDSEPLPISSYKFLGKSGTLTSVRSISGVLMSGGKKSFVSIISNNGLNQSSIIRQILRNYSLNTSCP